MMPDREKVIKGLEVCISIADGEPCPKDCPYYQEVCYGYDQLMRDALALLKEQEAVYPSWQNGKMYCGHCGSKFPSRVGMRFCHRCGMPIKLKVNDIVEQKVR